MINIDDSSQWEKLDSKNTYHESIHMPQNLLLAWEQTSVEFLSEDAFDSIHFIGSEFEVAKEICFSLYPQLMKNIPDERTLNIHIHPTETIQKKNTINIVRKGYLEGRSGVEVSVQDFEFFNVPQQCVILLKILDHYKLISEGAQLVHLAAANLIQKAGALCKAQKQPYNLAKNYASTMFNQQIAIVNYHVEYESILTYLRALKLNWKIDNIHIIEKDSLKTLAENNITKILILRNFYKEFDQQTHIDLQKFRKESVELFDVYSDGKNNLAELLSLIYFMNVMMFYCVMLQERTL
jgi:hypothetical protein